MSQVIEAEKFVLTDSQGRMRAELTMGKTLASIWDTSLMKEGPTLRFYDEGGNVQVELILMDIGPALHFFDENSRTRLEVSGNTAQAGWNTFREHPLPSGGPALRIRDKKGEAISHFGFNGVILHNPEKGQLLWINSKTRKIEEWG